MANIQLKECVALRVCALIMEANHWQWPCAVYEWRRVAKRFGFELCLTRRLSISGSRVNLNDRIIYIGYRPTRADAMKRAICHEVAEAVLEWEGEPEFRYWPSDPNLGHNVASAVEKRYIAVIYKMQ